MENGKLKAGDVMRNGATVLAHDPRSGVVLAEVCMDSGNYATWKVDPKDGAAYHGHYWFGIAAAARDYEERARLLTASGE